MILDALTHVTPDGRWFGSQLDASEDRLLREMDRAGVERAVVVALADHIENDFVRSVAGRHSDRLVTGLSVNPASAVDETAARELARSLGREAPFPVLKLHPRLHRYDPLDRRCIALLDELAAIPHPPLIWLDTLFHFRGGVLSEGPVGSIHRLVNRFPSLRFVLLHGAGPWLLQTAEAIRDCPNAWIDLSFTLTRYQHASVALDIRHLLGAFDRRMVWGSDFPEIAPADGLTVFRRAAEGIAEDKQANVLGLNLHRLLNGD